MTLNDALLACVYTFATPTGDCHTLHDWFGPRHAAKRQEILSALTGKKTTRAKSGVGAIRAALEQRFPRLTHECLASWGDRVAVEIVSMCRV